MENVSQNVENLSQQVELPLSYAGAKAFLQEYSALPSARALQTAKPSDLATMVEDPLFAPFLPALFTAALGAAVTPRILRCVPRAPSLPLPTIRARSC